MKNIRKLLPTIVILAVLAVLLVFFTDKGNAAVKYSWQNIISAAKIVIPVFFLVALIDVWVPKETFVRWMGVDSGAKAFFFAFIMGTLGAGPLYVAFPIAALLARKGVRFAAIIFMLGVWTSTKLPIFFYELGYFGVVFTVIHVSTAIGGYLMGSLIIEKILGSEKRQQIGNRLAELAP